MPVIIRPFYAGHDSQILPCPYQIVMLVAVMVCDKYIVQTVQTRQIRYFVHGMVPVRIYCMDMEVAAQEASLFMRKGNFIADSYPLRRDFIRADDYFPCAAFRYSVSVKSDDTQTKGKRYDIITPRDFKAIKKHGV